MAVGSNQAMNVQGMLGRFVDASRRPQADFNFVRQSKDRQALANVDRENPASLRQYAAYLEQSGRPEEAVAFRSQAKAIEENAAMGMLATGDMSADQRANFIKTLSSQGMDISKLLQAETAGLTRRKAARDRNLEDLQKEGRQEIAALIKSPGFDFKNPRNIARLNEIAQRAKIPPEQAEALIKSLRPEKGQYLTFETQNVLKDGKETAVIVALDPTTGAVVKTTDIGEVPVEEDDPESQRLKTFNSVGGAKLIQDAIAEKNDAAFALSELSSLVADAEKFAGDGVLQSIPGVGGLFGDIRDFAITDIAGLGDEVSDFRRRLRGIQMKNAIALLPRGPASDRDVRLAINASADLSDYTPEQRIAALRGMEKIKQAEVEYLEGKVRWIQQSKDVTGLGYEAYVTYAGASSKVEAAVEQLPVAVVFNEQITQALKEGNFDSDFFENEQAKLQAQGFLTFPNDENSSEENEPIDFLQMLDDRQVAKERYEATLKEYGMDSFL